MFKIKLFSNLPYANPAQSLISTDKNRVRMQSNNESSHIRVIVLFDAKEGKKQEILNLLVPLVDPPIKREGNVTYTFNNSSVENPNELLFDEVWDSKESYDKHYQSQESEELRSKLQDLVAKPIEFKRFKEIKGSQQ
jgi:quinol monooxygenase YgiN